MSAVCPKEGCQAKQGWCGHDVFFLVVGLVGLAGTVAHFGLKLV